MITIILILVYLCVFSFLLGLSPIELERRPSLKPLGFQTALYKRRKKPRQFIRSVAYINKPLVQGGPGKAHG